MHLVGIIVIAIFLVTRWMDRRHTLPPVRSNQWRACMTRGADVLIDAETEGDALKKVFAMGIDYRKIKTLKRD